MITESENLKKLRNRKIYEEIKHRVTQVKDTTEKKTQSPLQRYLSQSKPADTTASEMSAADEVLGL